METSIDQGNMASWSQEFDIIGFSIIQHLISSAVTASKEDTLGGALEESAVTTNELISRMLYIVNHGITSYSSTSNIVYEELERDGNILR